MTGVVSRVVQEGRCCNKVSGCLCHSEVVGGAWNSVQNWLAREDVCDSVTETAIACFLGL